MTGQRTRVSSKVRGNNTAREPTGRSGPRACLSGFTIELIGPTDNSHVMREEAEKRLAFQVNSVTW